MMMIAFLLFAVRASATIGVAAIDLDTGKTIMNVRSGEQFPMGSVYKLPIAMSVLRRVDRGELRLDQTITIEAKDFAAGFSPIRDKAKGNPVTMTVRDMVDAVVRVSDNTPSDYFVRTIGAERITADLRAIGITGIRVDRPETQIGRDIRTHGVAAFNADPRDTATPDGAVQLLKKLYRHEDGLTASSHDILLEMMTHSKNPERISKGVPPGSTVAHKTGTMPGVMNDIAIITTGSRHVALAVFTKNGKGDLTNEIVEIAKRVVR